MRLAETYQVGDRVDIRLVEETRYRGAIISKIEDDWVTVILNLRDGAITEVISIRQIANMGRSIQKFT